MTRALPTSLCLLLMALLGARPSAAAELSLRWNECAEGGGAGNRTFACETNLGEQFAVATLTTAAAVDSVVGMELVIDLVTATAGLPDWWKFALGTCRYAALSGAPAVVDAAACSDPWNGNGFAIVQSWEATQPRGAANTARVLLVTGVAAAGFVRVDPAVPYYAGVLRIANSSTVGAGACSGCSAQACLVFNSVQLVRHPAASPTEIELVHTGAGTPNWITWQGTSADCQAVPARRRTWGQIKSLYR